MGSLIFLQLDESLGCFCYMAMRHGHIMHLAPSDFTGLWGIAIMTSCQTSICSVKLNWNLLPALYFNANSSYIDTLHIWKLILPTRFFLQKTTLSGGEQRDTHVTHSWGKSTDQEGFGMDRVAAEEFALQVLGVEACKDVKWCASGCMLLIRPCKWKLVDIYNYSLKYETYLGE